MGEPAKAPPAIEVAGLVKRFDELIAVDGIELEVARGECVGLLGPNGAGKTTTVEILEGLQTPTAGEVRLLGLRWETDEERLRACLGITLQETRFYDRLSVRETLKLFRSFHARGLSVNEAIGLVQLGEKRETQLRKLSGGQRQRLALAVALVGNPEILFLDEPSTGLDPHSRRALWDVIGELKKQGRTVVLTTHYMEEAQALCDRVIILERGHVVASGTPVDLITSLGGEQVIEFETHPVLPPGVLDTLPTLVSTRPRGAGYVLTVKELHRALPRLLDTVRTNAATIRVLATRQATLDDVFLTLTGRSLREDNAS